MRQPARRGLAARHTRARERARGARAVDTARGRSTLTCSIIQHASTEPPDRADTHSLFYNSGSKKKVEAPKAKNEAHRACDGQFTLQTLFGGREEE